VGSLLEPLLKKVTPVVGSRMLCPMHGATTSIVQSVIVDFIGFHFGATIDFDAHAPKIAWTVICTIC
jgi:hypothetical protein